MKNLLILSIVCATACAGAPRPSTAPTQCVWPERPERVLVDEGGAELVAWELDYDASWERHVLPDSSALAAYRGAIERAGGALRRPIADPPEIPDERMREVWRREHRNEEVAFSGGSGEVREITCWEASMFARQAERHPPIESPTEFIAVMLLKTVDGQRRARIYFGAGPETFPPKAVYPFEAARRDVEQGWTMHAMLHNHTVRRRDGRPALGVPAPSTQDVALSRALAEELGLERVLVTNGFYTVDVPASALGEYEVPPPQ